MKLNTILGFIDITLNIAQLTLILFFLAFIHMGKTDIGPGKIDVSDNYIITLQWNSESTHDIDIHVMGPNKEVIGFRHQDATWGTLERDDRGTLNDVQIIDGVPLQFKLNREVIHLRNMADGQYVVNVHMYSLRDETVDLPQNIDVEMIQILPTYKVLFKQRYDGLMLANKEEFTAFAFDHIEGHPKQC